MLDFLTQIFRNDFSNVQNSKPEIPLGLNATVNNNEVTFSWSPAFDDRTPQNLLKYNVFIGTRTDSANILSPMADLKTGFQRVVNYSNAGTSISKTIKNLSNGIYYASVQTIDHTFSSSPFATPIQFKIQGSNLKPFSYVLNKEVTTNVPVSFNELDFSNNYSDPEDESLKRIRVVTLPSKGLLEFTGLPVFIGQEINSNDISKLVYKTSQFTDDSFKWIGSDGINFSEISGEVKIAVNLYKST